MAMMPKMKKIVLTDV